MIGPLMTAVSNRMKARNFNNKSILSQMLESRFMRGLAVLLLFGVLVYLAGNVSTFASSSSSSPSSPSSGSTLASELAASSDTSIVTVKTAGGMSAGHLISGSVNNVAYYHCGAHTTAVHDVILLHGAKFTKEDWKKSTILSKLCDNGKLSVTALDLSVAADAKQLQSILKGLAVGEDLISPEGHYVVVTPSASGKAVVDWINSGSLEELQETIALWIPIASPAISTASATKLKTLQQSKWPILALYGDKDAGGKKVSQRLGQEASAKVKEFPGPHPFYFDIPDQFTKYLLQELKVA